MHYTWTEHYLKVKIKNNKKKRARQEWPQGSISWYLDCFAVTKAEGMK